MVFGKLEILKMHGFILHTVLHSLLIARNSSSDVSRKCSLRTVAYTHEFVL